MKTEKIISRYSGDLSTRCKGNLLENMKLIINNYERLIRNFNHELSRKRITSEDNFYETVDYQLDYINTMKEEYTLFRKELLNRDFKINKYPQELNYFESRN